MCFVWFVNNIFNLLIFINKLFLANFSDDAIGIENIADYLLYWLNKHENFSYVEFLGLDKPCDNITEVLVKGSVHLKNIVYVRNFDNKYTRGHIKLN